MGKITTEITEVHRGAKRALFFFFLLGALGVLSGSISSYFQTSQGVTLVWRSVVIFLF
jgi:hypothetical protein